MMDPNLRHRRHQYRRSTTSLIGAFFLSALAGAMVPNQAAAVTCEDYVYMVEPVVMVVDGLPADREARTATVRYTRDGSTYEVTDLHAARVASSLGPAHDSLWCPISVVTV
jgi:hypothetical protein